jgi:phosphopantetheinyl transferase (holo-ACP synthase)
VVSGEEGAPSLVLRGEAAALASRLGVEDWRVSLTHTESLAQAVAVAL